MSNTKTPAKPILEIDLSGPDGNSFVIISKTKTLLRNNGFDKDKIEIYLERAMDSDYNNLLKVTREYVNLVEI